MTVNTSGTLLTRLGGVDVLSWNPVSTKDDDPGNRLVNNFGDLLGPLLVERIAGATAMRRTAPEDSVPPVLVAVGSILQFAPHDAVVWGSGVNFKLGSKLPRDVRTLDFRAVRGPYSARALTAAGVSVPYVFGDPALLLPYYMPELATWSRQGRGGLLVAPNLNDYTSVAAEASVREQAVIDPRGSLASVLRAIAGSGFVVGSSLHAIAIADALGIPARFVRSEAEGVLKYRDYLAGTGRPLERIAPDLDSALDLGGHAPAEVDLEALLSAFPHDLWGSVPQKTERVVFQDRPSILATWKEILAERAPDESRHMQRFVQDILPGVVEAGRKALSDVNDVDRTDAEEAFVARFADAYAHRLALAAAVQESDLPASSAPYLAALDTGRENQLLRRLWLDVEGGHALLRSVRSSNGVHVFSIALRPGSLTNELVSIEVIVEDSSGLDHNVAVPVFAMYHRQWTIDLCAAAYLGSEVQVAAVDVRLTESNGDVVRLPVRQVAHDALSLRDYPHVASAPRWSGAGVSEAHIDVEEEPSA